jgi:hypothetical protein
LIRVPPSLARGSSWINIEGNSCETDTEVLSLAAGSQLKGSDHSSNMKVFNFSDLCSVTKISDLQEN